MFVFAPVSASTCVHYANTTTGTPVTELLVLGRFKLSHIQLHRDFWMSERWKTDRTQLKQKKKNAELNLSRTILQQPNSTAIIQWETICNTSSTVCPLPQLLSTFSPPFSHPCCPALPVFPFPLYKHTLNFPFFQSPMPSISDSITSPFCSSLLALSLFPVFLLHFPFRYFVLGLLPHATFFLFLQLAVWWRKRRGGNDLPVYLLNFHR